MRSKCTVLLVFLLLYLSACGQGELHLSTEIPAMPGVAGLENGLQIPPPAFDLGIRLSIAL